MEEEARRSLNQISGGTLWVVFDKLEGWRQMSDGMNACVFKRLPVISNPSTFYNFFLVGGWSPSKLHSARGGGTLDMWLLQSLIKSKIVS